METNMPPKTKITKEDIVNAAINIVRNNGAQALNARTIANFLNCSTQPIFSNFAKMEELRISVIEKADELCQKYIQHEIDSKRYPVYKSTGMAYIRFAKEEKELFKLLYMRDRTNEEFHDESKLNRKINFIVKTSTGLEEEEEDFNEQ